jgi:hypothetical protein
MGKIPAENQLLDGNVFTATNTLLKALPMLTNINGC